MTTSTIRLVLVDAQGLFRQGLKCLLEAQPGLQVVGDARSAEDAMLLFERVNFEVALIDLSLPGAHGLWLISQMRDRWPQRAAVVLSHAQAIRKALDAGAQGYVSKSAELHELVAAIHQAYEGSPRLQPVPLPRRPAPGPADLTQREDEILQLTAQGFNSRTIADSLFLSVPTVKTHLRGIYRKLGVSDRTQAVLIAIERRMVRVDGRGLIARHRRA